jgi:hypothetical protein
MLHADWELDSKMQGLHVALTWRAVPGRRENAPPSSHFSTRHSHSLRPLPNLITTEQQRTQLGPTTHMLFVKLCGCTS